jgi:hypothetical protein
MLDEEENHMDLVPAGQPEDENANPPDEDQIDPAHAEREGLQAKVNSYINAVFYQQRVEIIAPAGAALWAATFNLQPAPLRGTRQKMNGSMVTLAWLYDQLASHQITPDRMGGKMVDTLMTSTNVQKEFYIRHLENVEEEGKRMKPNEEREEKAGVIKPLINANRYKIASNKMLVGGNAP